MPAFVFEIATEEMPAGFLGGLKHETADLLAAALKENDLEFDEIRTDATPRRIIAYIPNLADEQPKNKEVVTGPPVAAAYDDAGNPTKAAVGFAKSKNTDISKAFTVTKGKGEYLALELETGGASAKDLLPSILTDLLHKYSFPKKMHWGSRDFTFGRPVTGVTALLGSETIKLDLPDIPSGNTILGRRADGYGPWTVESADQYFDVLREKGKVIVGTDERKQRITDQSNELAGKAGGTAIINPDLLDEVSGLVEYPVVILGNFDPAYLEVPKEVLLTSMESHQKCFGVEDDKGDLLAHFLCTLNMEPKDVDLVRTGWERVLKARLEDARFFWRTDTAKELQEWVDELDNVVFLAPLGSMGDKRRRMESLCDFLAVKVAFKEQNDLHKAATIAKADLVSEMVGEFPELQGNMGGIYARKKGESETTAQAVYEHYLPAGPESAVPASDAGALLSIADRIDTLTGCFGLDMIPTGNDPYGLRRAALGIFRVLLEKGFRIDLTELIEFSQSAYGSIDWKLDRQASMDKLLEFFSVRLKNYFVGRGFSTLVVEAAVAAGIRDVFALHERLKALDDFSRQDDFEQAVLTFKRAGNIIRKKAGELGDDLDGNYDQSLLREEAEKSLAEHLSEATKRFDALWKDDKYFELMGLLRELRPHVDGFFDNVMVMCEDQALKKNRLNLLYKLVERLGRLADFNALQV